MDLSKQNLSALRLRLASLSFDPSALSDRELRRIVKYEKRIIAVADGIEDADLTARLSSAEAGLLRAQRLAQEDEANEKTELCSVTSCLLRETSELLTLPIFLRMSAEWFSDPPKGEVAELEERMSRFLAECGRIEARLIADARRQGTIYLPPEARREILLLRLALALRKDALPAQHESALCSISALSNTLDDVERSVKQLRATGLRIAVEHLSPMLGGIRPYLGDGADPSYKLSSNESIQALFRTVTAFGEQVRRITAPIFTEHSGGKNA